MQLIKNYKYQSDFAKKYFGEGETQGVRADLFAVLRKDQRKHTSWPIYEATGRARHRAACVLVVTPNETVARWADRPISLGPSGSVCRPLVIGPTTRSRPATRFPRTNASYTRR